MPQKDLDRLKAVELAAVRKAADSLAHVSHVRGVSLKFFAVVPIGASKKTESKTNERN
ncbi:hypothetical protein LMG28614_07313 [Paraburkholderia ultramafica]|uniref:Uncharacterized protein n=1 Tax=Paraburkholderia ultramafica TaxID=1544867 RepID=A0A6S7D8B7_9BURK|nr:hypothetical protein LMG28614_07313 [Paraburkholderia ultramafica]